jgi:hypothetical protein
MASATRNGGCSKGEELPLAKQDTTFSAAKQAARDLNLSRKLILWEAETNNKRFFIYLGKCLSGEIKINADILDPTDLAVADIVCSNPSIKAKDAVRELKKRGLRISKEDADEEAAFRMRRKRLGLSKSMRKRDAFSHDSRTREA